MTTAYHAKYFAHELTRRRPAAGLDRLSMSLFDACVDLNPHQIEAARFALQSPLSKGAILADEVGLGKTIEAGIVLCQYWAERRRRIIVICPASLRKQWSLELEEKFNLPTIILDARTYRQAQKDGNPFPFQTNAIIIVSINFASRMAEEVKAVAWDLAVIDEAHKLRNAYRPSNRMGQRLRWALEDRRKLLLTATPLQNTLLELYGLSTIIDDLTFGDVLSFRSQFMRQDSDLDALRSRLRGFCQRTLRNQVTEYIQYTERRAITQPFRPTDDEHRLYETLSEFFNREETYSIPARQRNLTALILRKLLASSSHAIAGTLDTMKERLIALRDGLRAPDDFTETLIAEEEMEDELLEPAEEDGEPTEGAPPPSESPAPSQPPKINREKLRAEIAELDRYVTWSRSIGIDTKSRALLKALNVGFSEMAKMGAPRKALVFTESRRTQNYLRDFLEANGFGGRIVLFNGTNTAADTRAIYDRWLESNRETGRATGSRQIDVRTAVIEHFRDGAEVMIATEAAAEGVNLQFCSLVINYDLPWNPQRIEQRIGRCHRYGQKHDVVVVNFLNQRNEADRRVLELLTEKFNLFSGVFGSSDEVLGSIESGVDFEKRILGIYQTCRTPQGIAAAFRRLRREMDASIQAGMDKARRTLLEHFDEDVHARLRVQLNATARDRVFATPGLARWTDELMTKAPTAANPDRTLLERHLAEYTARNTFDYFIHKNLGAFFRRELDFYIKNEIVHLDDIENESAPRVEQYLAKVRAIRRIAHKIIDFLAQIEDFQKKLWLKKKFVVETNYCITLDRVPEELYPEIVANDAQREEWVRLFAIDDIQGDLTTPAYSAPLTHAFLKTHRNLVLDTRFFTPDFTRRLLAAHTDLDDQVDGLLICSDNLQALTLIRSRFNREIDCIYIDPPYNTGGDGFCYKDHYQHSSWVSMLTDRIAPTTALATESATLFVSIDDNEGARLKLHLDDLFGQEQFESQIVVQSNKRGQTYKAIAKTHEYLLVYRLGAQSALSELPRETAGALKDEQGEYELWELRNRNPKFGRFNRPNLFFPIFVAPDTADENGYAEISLTESATFTITVVPRNSQNQDSCWRWGVEKVASALASGQRRVLVAKQRTDGGWNIYEKARKKTKKAKSIWDDTAVINEKGTVEVGALGLDGFGFPKPLGLLEGVLTIGCDPSGTILDFFAGSGTTAHAAILLNRQDEGARKHILVEMGDQFDRVLMPRLEKVVYSDSWSDGHPVSRAGSTHTFKYIRLESYEDALNNLVVRRRDDQRDLLDSEPALREDYTLRYMLDEETRGSPSLLNVRSFEDPFNYRMRIATGTVGETKDVAVDLVETFNWLLGLRVKHIDTIRGVRVVDDANSDGERVLVLWRNTKEIDNDKLDEWFTRQGYNTRDQEYAIIYVNGDNNLENLRRADQTWKVRITEDEFHRLMFDVQDV